MPACTRVARSRTSTSGHPPRRRGAAPTAQRCAAGRRRRALGGCGAGRASTPGSRRCGGATSTGSATGPAALDPLRAAEVLGLAPPGRRGRDGRGGRGLLGEHDFAAFCRRREGASTVRTLLRLEPVRQGEGLVETTVVADAFCHNMVRALMGALLAVGEGRLPADEPARILAAGVRDPRVEVLPGARADPRGGRLPAGRRAGGARRAGAGTAGGPRMSEHYFSARPGSPLRYADVAAQVWGHDLALRSASGVFSHGKVDLGTGCCVRTAAPDPAARTLLDLGCGYGRARGGAGPGRCRGPRCGRSTSTSGRWRPTRANADRRTGSATGCTGATPDDVPADLPSTRSGPTRRIRIGKPAVHELLLELAAAAGSRRPGGHGHRPQPRRGLLPALAASSRAGPATRLGSAKGFRVFEIRRPELTRPAARPPPFRGRPDNSWSPRWSVAHRRLVPRGTRGAGGDPFRAARRAGAARRHRLPGR